MKQADSGRSSARSSAHREGTLETADGVELFWRLHLPGGPPRAVLCFVHGLAEHSGRYAAPVDHLRPLGFACVGVDLRGHGRSSGLRVHVGDFDEYSLDVRAMVERAQEEFPGRPIGLVGHSMGGLVAIRFALDHPELVDALVISSPALGAHPDTKPPGWLVMLGEIASRVVPRLLFSSDLDAEAISRDEAVVAAYREDPLVSDKVSARWFTAFVEAQRDAFRRAGDLRVPVLLMQSGADRLVDPAATQRWAEAAPPDLVSFYTWPDFYHEMFHEPEKRRVFELVERWLEDYLVSR